MKAGTTSLHFYLSLHPEIFMSEEKEPTFFTTEKNWHRGVEWYSSLFETSLPLRGESSPDYTKFPAIDGVPRRIHSVLPDARMIYLVREPIERLVSHYVDAYSFGRVHQSIDRELANFETHHFVNCSRYSMQVEQYLEYFDADRVRVITTEELRSDPDATMRAVFEFLGVDVSFASREFSQILYPSAEMRRKTRVGYTLLNLSARVGRSQMRRFLSPRLMGPVRAVHARASRPIPRPELDERLYGELVECLRPDVARLRELTGRSFTAWRPFSDSTLPAG